MSTKGRSEKLLTGKELMQILSISETTLIRNRKNGVIPFIQIGKSIRYDLNEVINNSRKGGVNE